MEVHKGSNSAPAALVLIYMALSVKLIIRNNVIGQFRCLC